MPNSLLTGVSGLLAHQRLLDVVGNNIANMNTTGFKASRILFADLLYETIRPATGASDGVSGGINPNQIGGGVKVAGVDKQFGQGALDNTGGSLDFAISGSGFFTLTSGTEQFYTRAGAFSLDEQNFLVGPGGLHVQRFSSAGEPDGVNPGFQVPGDDRIRVPLNSAVEGVITSKVEIAGNLNADSAVPSAQQMQMTSPFEVGGAAAVATDLLSAIDSITTPYGAGDNIVIEGTTHDGTSQVFSSFAVNPASTIQDLMNAIAGEYPNATVSLIGGAISVESNDTGPSSMSVTIRNDAANSAEGIPLQNHQFQLTREGEDPGTASVVVEVFDTQGGAHEVKLMFEKNSDDIWSMQAAINPANGTLINDTISNILFDDNGKFIGSGPSTITMQINGIAVPQTISIDFIGESIDQRLTHFSSGTSISGTPDGSPPGVLTGIQVDSSGDINGVASNGKVFTLAKLAIATFINPKGLIATGDNMFSTSLNSGDPQLGEAGIGGRGLIQGGQLEASNVDVASEFTKLIVAQRGFSANARTITVSSEILEELTNIIR